MGSKSSSKSSSTSTNTTKTANLNTQGVEGDALSFAATDATVNITDGGAIEKNAEVTFKALEVSENITNKAFAANGAALKFAEDAGRTALNYVFDASQPEQAQEKNYTKTALVGLGILTAGYVLTKVR